MCIRQGRVTWLGVFQFPSNLKNNLLTLTPSQSSISCMLPCHCKLPMQILRMGKNLNRSTSGCVSVNLWFCQWTGCWQVVGSMMWNYPNPPKTVTACYVWCSPSRYVSAVTISWNHLGMVSSSTIWHGLIRYNAHTNVISFFSRTNFICPHPFGATINSSILLRHHQGDGWVKIGGRHQGGENEYGSSATYLV